MRLIISQINALNIHVICKLTPFPGKLTFKINTHLKLCLATAIHTFKCVQIIHICLF